MSVTPTTASCESSKTDTENNGQSNTGLADESEEDGTSIMIQYDMDTGSETPKLSPLINESLGPVETAEDSGDNDNAINDDVDASKDEDTPCSI